MPRSPHPNSEQKIGPGLPNCESDALRLIFFVLVAAVLTIVIIL